MVITPTLTYRIAEMGFGQTETRYASVSALVFLLSHAPALLGVTYCDTHVCLPVSDSLSTTIAPINSTFCGSL